MREDKGKPGLSRRKRPASAALPIPGPATAVGAADTASPDHDEWLLDEALTETFPASDPIRPATRDLPRAAPGDA